MPTSQNCRPRSAASSAQARDYDNVRIGVDVPYEPMEYRTAEGELTGFDIDIAKALCTATQGRIEGLWRASNDDAFPFPEFVAGAR